MGLLIVGLFIMGLFIMGLLIMGLLIVGLFIMVKIIGNQLHKKYHMYLSICILKNILSIFYNR